VQMIEPELAFADLKDDMACATAYLQYVVRQSFLSPLTLCFDLRRIFM
jgi:aspartyl/asparaginyl-tRNA synthetase